jgi:aminoglycoside phosphotransferase (APT) family kinase protein
LSETIDVREGEDFDLRAVERYLRSHVEKVPEGELEVSQFPSGASNLTYLLKVGDWEGVLRRPPLGKTQRRLPARPETVLLLRG